MVKVEVEVDTLQQLEEALQFPIDAVLLDNMDPATLKQAVALINGSVLSEASGGVTLETVEEIATTGVDLISVGALTHSPRNLTHRLSGLCALEPATALTVPVALTSLTAFTAEARDSVGMRYPESGCPSSVRRLVDASTT